MMHTSYPFQTVTLGAFPRTDYPFQTLTLGATGEDEIDGLGYTPSLSPTVARTFRQHRGAQAAPGFFQPHAGPDPQCLNYAINRARAAGITPFHFGEQGRLNTLCTQRANGYLSAVQFEQALSAWLAAVRQRRGLHGLGATGEAIDAANPPEKGERLWYERQAQGYVAGAVVGAVGVAAWLMSRKAKRVSQQTRVMIGAAAPIALMFAGGYARTMMPRGSVTPA